MGYNPEKPMEGRITDLGPPHYEQFFPPVKVTSWKVACASQRSPGGQVR